MNRSLINTIAFGAIALFGLTTASNAQTSTFDLSDEGWSIVSFGDLLNNYSIIGNYAPTYNASGGNPGGYISTTDPDGGDFTFGAPANFLGNKSGATGLSYDLTHPSGDINYQTTDLLLTGNGTRLLWKSSPDIVPGVGWTSVNVAFTPSSNWTVANTTGAAATSADFQNVLSHLDGIYIRGEYTNGLEVAGLDNVRLSAATPAPSSILVVLLGAVPLAGVLRRRRK